MGYLCCHYCGRPLLNIIGWFVELKSSSQYILGLSMNCYCSDTELDRTDVL